MKMNAETWGDLVSMTKAGALSWQVTAEAKGLPDKFTVQSASKDGRDVLLVRHTVDARQIKAICIMRYEATGSVFPCRFDPKFRKWKPKAAPQQWIALQVKSTEEIWKALKLCDFTLSDARATA